MCVLSSALGGWLLNICVTMGVCLSPTLASTSVCTHVNPAWASPPQPYWRAETSQDRRANKAYSLSVGPAGEKQRKRPILLLCKPLFHFHTSLSLSLLWYFTGFLAPVQVRTQYSYWDHSSHLLPSVRLSTTFSAHSYHLVFNKVHLPLLLSSILSWLRILRSRLTTTPCPIPHLVSCSHNQTLALECLNVQVMDAASVFPLRGP